MTTRLSNVAYLTVLDPLPLENIGWTIRVLSERDYATQIALVDRFDGLGFTLVVNDTGGGKASLDADDPIFTDPMPVGEVTPLVGQEALWQFYEDGVFRAEMLAEDVDEDVVPEGGGLRTTTFTGRGTGSVLDWAKVLPAGMPTPTTLARVLNMNPMAAWTDLFTECQAAGYLPFVSLLFDRYTNSAGTSWGAGQRVEVQSGDSMLDLLTRWCEAGDLTWKMLPGFRLQVMPVAAGRRLESKVVFTLFRGQEKHGRERRRREIATVVYAQSGDKGIAISADGAATTKWHKRMTWVQAGDASDATGRSAVANSTLALVKDEQVSRSIVVPSDEDGRRVFVDYLLTDWVTVEVPENDAESGARQVRAITVDVDSSAKVGLELTLQSRFQSRMEKMARKLEGLGASAGSSSGSSAITTQQVVSATKIEDLSNVDVAGVLTGDVLVWNGTKWVDQTANLDWLTDVDTVAVPPTDGQTLTYVASSGLWVPVTPAGGAAYTNNDRRWKKGPAETTVDEFNDSSIDAAWVVAKQASYPAGAVPTYVEDGDALSVKYGVASGVGGSTADGATGRHHGLIRPIGATMANGDGFVTAFTVHLRAAAYRMSGLVLSTSGVSGAGQQLYVRWWNSVVASANVGIRNVTAWLGDVSVGTDYTYMAGLIYLRIVRLTSTTWRYDVSVDGVQWILGNTASTWAFEPTHVGFAESNWNTATPSVTSYEFLRRVSGIT